MIIHIPYKPKTVLALLVSIIILTTFSLYFFTRLGNIVHEDLYNFGLVFNYSWANPYWVNSDLYLYSIQLALLFFGNSIAFFLLNMRTQKTLSGSLSGLLLIVAAGLSIFSIYPLSTLDYIVNHDLYSYGLTFSNDWYASYSLDFLIIRLLVFSEAGLALVSSIVVFLTTQKTVRLVLAKLVDSTMVAIGTVALAFSIVFSSSVIAIIGLGLLFWGITFSYVRTEEYVKKVLLEATAMSQLSTLNKVIQELEFTGNVIYLPSQYFRNSDEYKVYIPKEKLARLPTPEMMYEQEPEFFIDFVENPPAVLMTPPGAELAQLFEKTLKTSFSRIGLQFLQENLPKLLIEDLEVAQYLDIEIEKDTVRVAIEDSIYSLPKTEAGEPSIFSSFGSPLSSAIACAIANVTGKPVMRVKPRTGVDERNVVVEYRILETGT